MKDLTGNPAIFGGVSVIFAGDFHQLMRCNGKPLYKSKCVEVKAINNIMFLHMSHRFDKDPEYGSLLRRFCYGRASKKDIQKINTRFIGNDDVHLPNNPSCIRYACATNKERNAISSKVFLQHLQQTHSTNKHETCHPHTVIIKGSMTTRKRRISRSLRNTIYDTCGDSNVKDPHDKKIDPVLKFFYNIPLMLNNNDRIDEKLGNGTPCHGLYLVLKEGATMEKENWNGYYVNTIEASLIKYIVCSKKSQSEEGPHQYFYVEPQQISIHISIPSLSTLSIRGIKMEQLPMNDNIATTGHKLQGATLTNLIVKSWDYKVTNWIYVVLSRVKQLTGLVLCQPLDENRNYTCDPELTRFEKRMKHYHEIQLFKRRDEMREYHDYESKYNNI